VGLGSKFQGQSVEWVVRAGRIQQNVPVTLSGVNPKLHDPQFYILMSRKYVKDIHHLSNQLSTKNHLYKDYFSDSAVARTNLQDLAIQCLTQDKPLIIRCYGRNPGGAGTHPTTQSIDGFIEYHEKIASAAPYCQLEGQPDKNIEWKDLRKTFNDVHDDSIPNVLGVTLMNYPNLFTNVSFPEFLETEDLLRLAGAKYDDYDKGRNGLQVVTELGFAVISTEGSMMLPHEDNWATVVVCQEGCKAWWFAKTFDANRETRVSWKPSDGLMGFKDSYTVDLQVGDLLIMSPGQIHGVYSPQNAFLVGAHFIIAEILVSTLKAATRHREYNGVRKH